MKDLVYRVHALPATLLSYVFDFGFLEEDIEQMYVKAMTQRQFPKITDMEVELVASAMHACLNSVREIEREGSAVSLRDVKRYLLLTDWFGARGNPGSTGNRGLQANSGSPSNRFLDHTGYAASMSLNYPCAEAYSAYVFTHLYPRIESRIPRERNRQRVARHHAGGGWCMCKHQRWGVRLGHWQFRLPTGYTKQVSRPPPFIRSEDFGRQQRRPGCPIQYHHDRCAVNRARASTRVLLPTAHGGKPARLDRKSGSRR